MQNKSPFTVFSCCLDTSWSVWLTTWLLIKENEALLRALITTVQLRAYMSVSQKHKDTLKPLRDHEDKVQLTVRWVYEELGSEKDARQGSHGHIMGKWAPGHKHMKGPPPLSQYIGGRHVIPNNLWSLFVSLGLFCILFYSFPKVFVVILCILTELCEFQTRHVNTHIPGAPGAVGRLGPDTLNSCFLN